MLYYNYMNQSYQRRLMAKARLASRIMQFTPFIRMIGLNGSLARFEAKEKSDIDFLIIAKKDRIWSCRAFSVILMAIFGLKRYQNRISGRVCLNLYQTENHLELTTKTKYLAKNYSYTLPLWQSNNLFKDFMLKNKWIKQFDQSFIYIDYEPSIWERWLSYLIFCFRLVLEFVFDLFLNDWGEEQLKKYQKQRIGHDQRTIAAGPGEVFLSDEELRFHLKKS